MASRRGVLVPAVLLIPEEAGFSKDLEVVGDRRLVLLTPVALPYSRRTLAAEVRSMTAAKTRRLEVRTDEQTEQLVVDASALLQVSKTAFIEDAVRAAARMVVARADLTLMSADVFDSMMAAIDEPDHSAALDDLARLPRLIER